MRCSTCGTENPPGAKFCHQCGSRLAQVCPTCGFQNLPEARFCNECGARLGAASPAAGAPAAPAGPHLAPSSASPDEPARADDERRPVTLLFADLVGFTTLAERLDPEDARELTNIALGRLAREVAVYGGTVDKFIGDAVLALFGAPTAHEDDAERAVSAALAMQRAIAELNETHPTLAGAELAIRVGVNTGLVVVGAREIGGRQEYTAIGDPVNVAARLQAVAEPGTVLVGEATYRAASRHFVFEVLPPLALRGRSELVEAFRVVGRLGPADETVQGEARAFGAPLSGRTAELGSLRYCLDELLRGRGQIAFVLGEAGIGKTRLVAELHRLADGEVGWAQARAFSYGQNLPYGMFNGTIRGMFPVEPFGVEGAAERLMEYLRELKAEVAFPFLAFQLGLPVDPVLQAELEGLAPREFQQRVLGGIREWLKALARRRPLVMELDDVHWADPSSLELLDGWLDLADQVPIFFCYLMRPERESRAWQIKERAARSFPHRYTEIDLSPLSEADSRELVRHLLPQAALRPHLEAQILARTEGNPFFVEEVVRDLAERDLLAEGGPHGDEGGQVALPENLQTAIVARIDRLREPVRRVLQIAAVVGRGFKHSVLQAVLGGHPGLDDDLREAERADLIREVAVVPEREYSFRHLLVQEAAYNTLLVRRRRELHLAVAEAIEQLYADRLEESYDELAHHYAEAEAWDRVLGYAERAADRAMATHANREALEHYSRALRAVASLPEMPDPAWLAALYEKRGDVQAILGPTDDATQSFQSALDLVVGGPGPSAAARGRLGLKLARVAMLRQDPVGLAGHLASTFEHLSGDDPLLASAWALKAWEQVWWNDYAAAAASADRAMELARAHGAFEQIAEAYQALSHPSVASLPGRDFEALGREWVDLAEARDDPLDLFNALTAAVLNQAWIAGVIEPAVLGSARRGLALAQEIGSPAAAARARAILGACLVLTGDWDEAATQLLMGAGPPKADSTGRSEEFRLYWLSRLLSGRGDLERALGLLEDGLRAPGFPHSRIWFTQELARNRLAAGDFSRAREALVQAAEAAERIRCGPCNAGLAGVSAEAWAALGEVRRAERAAEEAFRWGKDLQRRPTTVAAHRASAALALRRERWEDAARALRAALRLCRAIDQPYEAAQTSLQLALALAASGKGAEVGRARGHLRFALERFEALGARPGEQAARAAAAKLGLDPDDLDLRVAG